MYRFIMILDSGILELILFWIKLFNFVVEVFIDDKIFGIMGEICCLLY